MKNILITDSLFIFPEHEKMLKDAGFNIERLDKPQATEDELIEALKDKHGYILGGIEKVTDKVIASTDTLEAICFTGSDYRYFIPGYKLAQEKGISITNCPGVNSGAVADYTFTLMFAMMRDIFDLGRTGSATFRTTPSLSDSTVGIIGMGHIGQKVARMLKALGVKNINYSNRTRNEGLEKELGINYLPIEKLLLKSDIVTIHVSKEAGEKYFNTEYIKLLKDNSILINCAFESIVDEEALYVELLSGRIRCAQDGPAHDPRYKDLPLHIWFNSNAGTGFNTHEANKAASDMSTKSIINLLTTGTDGYKIK